MIKIYDINDNVLMMAEVTSAAVRVQELSKSDYIQLSFSTAEKVILPVGAYIEHTYKIDKVREVTRKFLLLESYEPTQSTESSWKYTPEFQHPKMMLSKTPFYISTYNSQKEKIKQNIWSFVGTTETLSGKIADFLNKDIKFGNCGWVCDMTTVTANTVNVSFSDNDFISALSAIANAIGDNCEWHIDYDNETVYIGKIVLGDDSEVLEVGKNVGVPSITSSRESYYNAFSIFGGTRNITQKNEKEENISSGDIRLQLSAGTGSILTDGKERAFTIDEFSTIDLREDKKKEPLFTKVLDFSDIFPSLNTYVYDVRGREKYVLDDNNKKIPVEYNSDGSVKAYKTFTVWYMRLAYPTTEKISGKTIVNTTVDDGVTHYWYDFEITDDLLINGKNIGCSFEANFAKDALSTPLAGRGTNGDYVGFELTYHKEDSATRTGDDVSQTVFMVKKGDYEILYQEDNNVIIPSNAENMLIPRGEDKPSLKCNITVLYNIAMKESAYTQDAQKRLLEAAKKEIIRLLSDLNNYSFKSYPQVFIKENPCLQIAQAVTYKDGNGYSLESRVLKLETNLDYNFVQTITVGNQTIKGTTTQLREDVQKIIASGSGDGSGEYTAAQLSNQISRFGTRFFLSKLFDDTAKGKITFEKLQKFLADIIVHGVASLNGGATIGNDYGFDKDGNVVLNTLQSADYENADQEGYAVEKDGNGKYHQYISNLTVWGKMHINELEINKLSYAGGNIYLSGAGSKIVKCVPVSFDNSEGAWKETTVDECSGWKCYLLADNGEAATENHCKVGDQVRCQTMGEIKSGGAYSNASNKSYWRVIPRYGVSTANECIYSESGQPLYDGQRFAWIVISKHSSSVDGYNESNAPEGTRDYPSDGDVIVLDGSKTDSDRQNVLILESVGDYAPRIIGFHGVNTYSHDNKDVFVISPKGVKIKSSYFKLISESNENVIIPNYRGLFSPQFQYHVGDQVSYNNAIWTCIKDCWQIEPNDDESDYWSKDVYGQKGKDGSSFKVLGTAEGHFKNREELEKTSYASGVEYLVDDASGFTGGTVKPSVVVHEDALSDWLICESSDGDSYMVGDDLWTNSGAAWLNIGNVKGVSINDASVTYGLSESGTTQPSSWVSTIPATTEAQPYLWTRTVVNYTDGTSTTSYSVAYNGKDGERGEDGVTIDIEGSPIVFNADENGLVPEGLTRSAYITVRKGGKNVSSDCGVISWDLTNVSTIQDPDYDKEFDSIVVSIPSSEIAKTKIDSESSVSATSGGVDITIAYNKVAYSAHVSFVVNISKYTGQLLLNDKEFAVEMKNVNTQLGERPTTEQVSTLISSSATTIKAEAVKQTKDDMKSAGMEITSDGITLYGDKITINNGETTVALFQDGKINVSLIDADSIEVKHLWAKNSSGTKVGYFGNTEEDACKIDDNTLAPLFVGGNTAKTSPFYVTSKGAMHATSGYIGGFSIEDDGIVCDAGENSMYINTSFISFSNEEHGIENIVGANWNYGIDYTAQQIIVNYDHPTKMTYGNGQATGNQMNTGLYISVSGTKHQLSRDSWQTNSPLPCGNHAVLCEQGDFAGFRPCYRRITASQTLTKYDVFLEVVETWKKHNDVTGTDTTVDVGTVTISLPKDPEVGQMYWIVRSSKYNYTLKTTDGTLIYHPKGNCTSYTLTTANELVCIIYNGANWRLMWNMGK